MIEHSATLSDCGRYRYDLKRIWDPNLSYVLWIGLNPSTADAEKDDPTIRKMMGFARKWQHGGIVVCNLFACRSTDPAGIKSFEDPVGPENFRSIRTNAHHAGKVICCWGNHGSYKGMDRQVYQNDLAMVPQSHCLCLGYTKAGHPKHPGRIAYATPLQKFTIRRTGK